MDKKIGIIGSGMVSIALANGLQRHGYEIMIGTNDINKHDAIAEKTIGDFAKDTLGYMELRLKTLIGSFAETAQFSDLLILAVKGSAAEEALRKTGIDLLKGKIVLDATNPISDGPPTNGVLPFFTTLNESLMERLQNLAPETHFVKCFSCVGNALMVDPDFGGEKPTMFICGNKEQAKLTATDLLSEIGWETEDMGQVEAARAIEPLCILWCLPGFNKGQWRHAFKLLK